jgi:hypothetical protein
MIYLGAMVEEQLRKVLNMIFDTHLDSMIDCETCESQFNCLAEMVAAGADLHTLLPAVEEHLACCPDCREEFECLLAMIRAQNSSLPEN